MTTLNKPSREIEARHGIPRSSLGVLHSVRFRGSPDTLRAAPGGRIRLVHRLCYRPIRWETILDLIREHGRRQLVMHRRDGSKIGRGIIFLNAGCSVENRSLHRTSEAATISNNATDPQAARVDLGERV